MNLSKILLPFALLCAPVCIMTSCEDLFAEETTPIMVGDYDISGWFYLDGSRSSGLSLKFHADHSGVYDTPDGWLHFTWSAPSGNKLQLTFKDTGDVARIYIQTDGQGRTIMSWDGETYARP